MASHMPETYEFNTQFIAEVEKYPVLYNFNSPEYLNRINVEKAWDEISQQVKCTVEQCKDRWKNIRNCYLRYLRNQKSQSPNHRFLRRPYYLQAHLTFLEPFTKIKSKQNNLDDDEKEYFADSQCINQVLENELKFSSMEDSNLDESVNSVSLLIAEDTVNEIAKEPRCTKRPHEETNNYTPKERKTLKEFAFEHKVSNKRDDTEELEKEYLYFFKSLMPDLKIFTRKQGMTFKKRVLELIEDISE